MMNSSYDVRWSGVTKVWCELIGMQDVLRMVVAMEAGDVIVGLAENFVGAKELRRKLGGSESMWIFFRVP